MSKAIRQENLYGAEDWTVVYTSFKNAEFTSYDFDTLRQSMVDYMQINYAEEYNDYIQSSEFIALLDLVAYVGQNLAFRMDLNARENILDTAEKRESVLRIARMLSYKPKRVRPAQGFLKVTSVQTTENIIDSTGRDISNSLILWGADPSDIEYERFTSILNSAFNANNPFGTPANRVVNSTNGNIFEIYKFNNSTPITNYPVAVVADGNNFNFDLVSTTIDTDGILSQDIPNPAASFNILYRTDGKGVGSSKTGFFVMAKQGYMTSRNITIDNPQSNLVVDIEQSDNISEEDFYVQTVDALGNVLKTWKRVGDLDYTNIVVNNYGTAEKDLYEVMYSAAEVTSIKFGDGELTNAPSGYLKVWYRLAENDYIRVKANEIDPIEFTLRYADSGGSTHTLTMTLELQDNMTTGLPAESIDEIKNNAPEVFYSKNRMVTGDDYNVMLPTLNNDVLLLKAENRTFSGHSRNVDLTDPTGKSRPLIELGSDGYIFKDETAKTRFYSDTSLLTPQNLLNKYLLEELTGVELVSYYYAMLALDVDANSLTHFPVVLPTQEYTWNTVYSDGVSCNGYITLSGQGAAEKVGATASSSLYNLRPNALIKVGDQWATVVDVVGDGTGVFDEDRNYYAGNTVNGNGTIELNKSIESGVITVVVPSFPRTFDDTTAATIRSLLFSPTTTTFSISYDSLAPAFTVTTNTQLTTAFNRSTAENSWLMFIERDNVRNGWIVTTRAHNYVFGSEAEMRFYNLNAAPLYGELDTVSYNDKIDILTLANNKFASRQQYDIIGYYTHPDGYTDSSKVKILYPSSSKNFVPDDPEHFLKLLDGASYDSISKFDMIPYEEGEFIYEVPQNTVGSANRVRTVVGETTLAFKWTHNVTTDQTLNPSLTNIIDVYVLTKTYNLEFSAWKKKNSIDILVPLPLTSEELRNSFPNLSSYKMLTDEVVFHPVKFKPLFGALADDEYRAEFKIVKSISSKLTDNEIKGKVISAIDDFFTPGNFDFGEKFFFTELSTYIHSVLSTDISSVVIVPTGINARFGTMFQMQPNRDEIVTSVATVSDVTVINELTDKNIKIGK